MSLGCSGGMQIPPAIAHVLVNSLAFNDSLSNAIEKPRVFYDIATGHTDIEGMLTWFFFKISYASVIWVSRYPRERRCVTTQIMFE